MAVMENSASQNVFPEKLDLASALDILPPAARSAAHLVNLHLSPDDGMYGGDDRHYLSCGASALNARATSPGKIVYGGTCVL